MKKFFSILLQFILFLGIWAVGVRFIPIPAGLSPALSVLLRGVIALALAAVLTLVFELIAHRRVPLFLIGKRPDWALCLGVGSGAVLSALTLSVMTGAGFMASGRPDWNVSTLLWAAACVIDAAALETVFRGYLYRVVRGRTKAVLAAAVTSLAFVLLRGIASGFSGGILPAVFAFVMNLLLAASLEASDSLIVPFSIHAVFDLLCGVVFGALPGSAPADVLFRPVFANDPLLHTPVTSFADSLPALFVITAGCVVFAIAACVSGKKRRSGTRGRK